MEKTLIMHAGLVLLYYDHK